MNQYFSNFLQESLRNQKSSIKSYNIENQKVWLKKASSRHSTWIYIPLSWSSKLLGLSMLSPIPNYGGEKSIACEISRIKQLKNLGVSVPEILTYSDQALLLKDAAQNGTAIYQLESALFAEKTTTSRLSLYADALKSLQHVHDLGSYLSEAFARNILVDNQRNFTYIDFETDPGQLLTLHECQTRDWLCFIFSTAHCFEDNELNQASDLLANILFKNNEIYTDIYRVGRKIKWILKLKLEKLGGDGRRLKKCIILLKSLENKRISNNEPIKNY